MRFLDFTWDQSPALTVAYLAALAAAAVLGAVEAYRETRGVNNWRKHL
jgi:hypothetical protein